MSFDLNRYATTDGPLGRNALPNITPGVAPVPTTGLAGSVVPLGATKTPQQMWAEQAWTNIAPMIGPKRTQTALSITDPVARMDYITTHMDPDEYTAYYNWLGSNPTPSNTPTPTPTAGPPPPPPPPPAPVPTPTPVPTAPAPTGPPKPGTKEYYLQEVNKTFQPGFEYTAAPSSLLDGVISEILTEQKGAATDYLNRGQARGIYNDVGYNAGMAALGDDSTKGSADLATLGDSALAKYRTEMGQVADNAYQAASGYSPGLAFSLDPYMTEFNSIKGRASNNIEGDVRNLLGGKNYFDFSDLTSHAGMAQGALNLRDTDVATALAERTRKNSMARGLGSQGAF